MDPPPPPDVDYMDEDMELQLALALSLQETTAADIGTESAAAPTPAPPPPAPAPAVAAPPPAAAAPAPAPGPPAGFADLAALLSQGLQAAAQAVPPPPAPVAAAPPPPPPQAAPQQPMGGGGGAGGGGDLLASLLSQFFAGQGAPGQQQQQQQQQQAGAAQNNLAAALAAAFGGGMLQPNNAAAAAAPPQTGGSRAASARQQAAPAAAPLPAWAAKLRAWNRSAAGGPVSAAAAGSVTLAGAEQLAVVCGHLGEALQVKVVSDSAALGAGALFMRTSGGGRELSAEGLQGLVNTAMSQRRVAPKDRLQALHRAHDALPASCSLPEAGGGSGVAAALDLFSGVLAREAFGLLREDGADLYFDTGAHTAAFVDALAGGPASMCEPFLEALLDASASDADSAVWQRLLRDALKSSFGPAAAALGDAMGLERPLVVLDRATCTPRLQQCLAALLLADVEVAAKARPAQAARELEKSSVLGPLFGASPFPSGQDALYHWKVTSPARQAFLETRGYPKNHGAGQSCRTVMQALMARVQDGAGNIMLRLSRVKDGGLSREAMLSWVSAVGRANLGRLAFGESQEMRSQQDIADFLAGGSDGFLLNVTGGCLRLAQPFVSGWLDLYRTGHDPAAASLTATLAASASASASASGSSPASPGAAVPRWADLFDKHLQPEYYRTQRHRLGDLSAVFNATGSRGAGGFTADDDPPTTAPPLLLAGSSPEGGPSFISDVFFLTQLMLHVGPMPTVYRKRALLHRFRERYQREMAPGAASGSSSSGANGGGGNGADDDGEGLSPGELAARGGGGRDPWSNPLALELQLLEDCSESALGEPLLADNLTAFAVLELDWVAWVARGGAGGSPSAALALVPEYALGDALDWLAAVLYAGRADLVAAKPIGVIMRAMVSLLNANHVVRSAMLQNKIVNLLLAMLASQIQNVQAREARGLALAPDRMSTGERALVGAVLGAPATQRDLIPALLRAHVNAELVVGLDVDKDSYDKYGMRNNIDKILEELIKDSALKRCLTDLAVANVSAPTAAHTERRDASGAAASTSAAAPAAPAAAGSNGAAASAAAAATAAMAAEAEAGLFSDYASGIVNTVMHYFKDGLDRLADIYAIERSKANAAAWAALPAAERQRKEDFYRGQQRAARGFLHMGVVNLKWLNTLTADPLIGSAFLAEPLRGKAAFLVVSSLELLLGDACKKLQVLKPEQYGFDLPVLVGSVMSLQLQLGAHDRFVAAVAAEPDYSEEIMARALQHTISHHQAEAEARLNAFLARAAEIKAARAARRPAALAAAAAAAAAGGGGGESGSSAPDTPSGSGVQPPLKRPKSMEGSGIDAMEVDGEEPSPSPAPPGGLLCEAVALPGPAPSTPELEAAYAAELGPLSVAEYDSTVPGGYFKEMSRLADQDSGASRKKMKQLARELADMQAGGKLTLPCHANAAVFVRQDAARMDKMRAVLTGPQGTPYEGGLFVFDIFCPAGYPSDPPVMMVYNTGGGKARYNPNLYADGKVCLSLLGTYNSGHTSEKWNPSLSTIYQVLVSVQSQILVDDPMTNEPLSETMAGTAEGAAKTAEYNARLQLMVMRHAMVDCLRHPPPGTAEVVRRHFTLLRHRLADTVRRWVRGAPTEELRIKLDEQATILLRMLAEL